MAPYEKKDENGEVIERGHKYITLEPEVEKVVRAEMEDYLFCVCKVSEIEYDDDDYPSRSHDFEDIELGQIVSMTSPTYSSSDTLADIIVIDGHLAGVLVKARRWGGNGIANNDETWYCALYIDGTKRGENKSQYFFHGSSSSKEYEWTYTLEKKEK